MRETSTTSKVVDLHIPCPVCPSSDAYCTFDDGHGYCFSCSYYKPKDGFDLSEFTYEYLPHRNVSADTFRFYGANTKIDGDGKPTAIGFEYPNGSVKVRTLGEKGFYTKGDIAKAGLFGRNKFGPGSNRSVTITEGELDALSLYQVLKSPVVSVRSSVTARMDASIDRSYLNSFERIYLAFDGDEPGRAAAAEVAKLFDYNKVYDVRFPGGSRKDANDYLQAGEDRELREIWWHAKKFLPDNLISSLSDFEKELLKPVKYGVSYPFPTLNNMTYGMRTGEVVLLTAQEGVGKTEVMHTILHHLLKETQDAVGAIFIEESKQRLLQALSGIELQRPVHLPDSGVEGGAVVAALKQVVPTDDRLYVYNHFGSDSADSIIDTIRFLVTARGCRWIFFDLISLAVAGLGGDREREALEYLSARLELMTQELDFGLIMVSHVNDNGQTRGSRMIAKNCHVRIDLDRDVSAVDERTRLTTKLTVTKNRPTSMTGPAGQLLFNMITHTLNEDLGIVESPPLQPLEHDNELESQPFD
jgi:twinkle protein